ncbi:uncharacterized protein BKA78DRAFT_150054 [Phyllosticta capitalensis]|uniref:uncharacterized protein n=1 Tax=Phyllosticta capitalensis TaxID=121624 RepID=UPI00312DF297
MKGERRRSSNLVDLCASVAMFLPNPVASSDFERCRAQLQGQSSTHSTPHGIHTPTFKLHYTGLFHRRREGATNRVSAVSTRSSTTSLATWKLPLSATSSRYLQLLPATPTNGPTHIRPFVSLSPPTTHDSDARTLAFPFFSAKEPQTVEWALVAL